MSVEKRQAALLSWRHHWITPLKGVSLLARRLLL
jgi:hypothetical protein